MAKNRVINIVATVCDPKKDAEFNKWYNEVHIPMLLKFKGLKKVTRFGIIDDKAPQAKYLAVYEYDTVEAMNAMPQSQEFKDAIAEMQQSWPGNSMEIKWAAAYAPIKTWG
jgi:hypothetical protein